MIRNRLTFLAALLLALGLLVPTASADPGDGAPPPMEDDEDEDDDDEDDEDDDRRRGPSSSSDNDEDDYQEDDEEDEPSSSGDAEDTDDESSSSPDEDEEALEERYRVVAPDSEDEDEEGEEEEEEEEAETKADAPVKLRGIVKVIQKKFFLKYRRLEVTPHVGYIGNDNFIRRFAVGSSIGYHINDLLSVEATFSYLPDLKETDYKALTNQFKDGSEVVPDISKVIFLGVINAALSPIYGKIEMGNLRIINYDLYFTAGIGVAYSEDDLDIVQDPAGCSDENYDPNKPGCEYVKQWHFVSNAGGGFRVVFNEWIGIRLDARGYTHIEQVFRGDEADAQAGQGDIGLEMKQNFMISLGASFFFPPRPRSRQQD